MKMKTKFWVASLGLLAVIGSFTLLANEKKQSADIQYQTKTPVVKTVYTGDKF